jgi:23S rRNA (cytosine1962-C5)-methyltransferase
MSRIATKVILLPKRARPFFARHPWVFANSISRIEGDVAPGAEVDVWSQEGQWIARGLYNPHSAIRVRLYRWDQGPLDLDFWRNRIESALELRRHVLRVESPGSAYRAIHSEGDGLSGLIVDRFDRWLVVQFTSLALFERRDEIVPLLLETSGALGCLIRIDKNIADQEGLRNVPDPIVGEVPESSIEITENDVTYFVDLKTGQKSGFYLDQRENRRRVASFCEGKRVLDLFCYSGGFALSAVRNGKAAHAIGIDSSAPAIELARRNAVANKSAAARFETADVFDVLDRLKSHGEKFGVVIADPPKYARNAKGLDDALKAYLRLNRAAVEVVEPGGLLATCSCSGHVDSQMFARLLSQVAELSGRTVQILEQRGQSPDHPVAASCLETEYLKCFLCRVV